VALVPQLVVGLVPQVAKSLYMVELLLQQTLLVRMVMPLVLVVDIMLLAAQ